MSYTSRNEIVSSLNGGSLAGFRNRLLNGDMRIDQGNAGVSTTINGATGVYSVDQWFGFGTASAGVFTLQQQTATPPGGVSNYLRFTTTTADASPAAGANYFIEQPIEGYNIQDLQIGTQNAATITFSFQARSSLTGTFSGALQNSAANRSYAFTFSLPTANTWTTVFVTITLDNVGTWLTTNGVGLRVIIDMGSGATARGTAGVWSGSALNGVTGTVRVISTISSTFDLTTTQLEPGPIATVFEVRDFATELYRLQRYFYAIRASEMGTNFGAFSTAGIYNSTTNADVLFTNPVKMRTTANAVAVSAANNFLVIDAIHSFTASAAALDTGNSTPNITAIDFTTSAATQGQYCFIIANNSATAWITVSARM